MAPATLSSPPAALPQRGPRLRLHRGRRPIKVGTPGWSFEDFEDEAFDRFWDGGNYEICEGVLTDMSAKRLGWKGVGELAYLVTSHTRTVLGVKWEQGPEPDIILNDQRVVRADYAFFSAEDLVRQGEARERLNLPPQSRRRRNEQFYVPPTLLIESVSEGHEAHDTRTKRAWYAEFGVPNYWILDAIRRRLDCLTLEDGAYVTAASGTDREEVRPPVPEGLVIPLGDLWVED